MIMKYTSEYKIMAEVTGIAWMDVHQEHLTNQILVLDVW